MASITNNILVCNYKPPYNPCRLDKKASYQCPVSSGAAANGYNFKCRSIQCIATPTAEVPTERRSGNYSRTNWDFESIQKLNSEYEEERHLRRVSELVMQVKAMLEEESELVARLELINDLQRLGLSRHFENEIKHIFDCLYEEKYGKNFKQMERDLYSTSLEFRLMRQDGYNVPQEVFDCFLNEKGELKSSYGGDTKGILQMYEASFLLTEGEDILDVAKEWAPSYLKKRLHHHEIDDDQNLLLLVGKALEIPTDLRSQRPNVRWFIDAYGSRQYMNPVVLELAKLDFNIVQATFQQELKVLSRWWESTRLPEILPFARDRIVECYYWTTGIFFGPRLGYTRITAAKINQLVTSIDDIFDVYGTLEELELFTDVVQRWDVESIDHLPNYMQICFLALNNFVNDVAYNTLTQQGFNTIPYLRRSWTDLIQRYLKEAKWYYSGYKPSLEEYLDNAWVSISGPALLTSFYFLVTNPINKEVVDSVYEYHDIVRCSSLILRLADDFGTSTDEIKRGDVPKAIQCYMNERNASEEEAREYVTFLMRETWKEMNKERISTDSPFTKDYMASVLNLPRMAMHIYETGDGFGINNEMHDLIELNLFKPYT